MHEAAKQSVPGYLREGKTKKRGAIWSEDMKTAVLKSQDAHRQWVAAGKPRDQNNSLLSQKNVAGKQVQSVGRQQVADERTQLHTAIMDATDNNDELFYALIRAQRKTPSTGGAILSTDQLHVYEYYSGLAKPLESDTFDELHYARITADQEVISSLCATIHKPAIPASPKEIKEIVADLNKGKAPDKNGLTAEHLQLGGTSLIGMLTRITNDIILKLKAVPDALKSGILTPVPKKNKDFETTW
jgi:hypothetical protein